MEGKIYKERLEAILLILSQIKDKIPKKSENIFNSLEQDVSAQLKQFNNTDFENNYVFVTSDLDLQGFELFCKALVFLSEESNKENDNIAFRCPDCAADLEWQTEINAVKFIKHNT